MSGHALTVVGGGLAGCEAAWQAAERGLEVVLLEMRPGVQTGAHQTDRLAEIVCSNSLGSALPDRASGILMAELEQLGSLLLRKAREAALPAGGALAVDRGLFSAAVTAAIEDHPRIHVRREEVHVIPDGLVVIASGPLTSAALAADLARLTGEEHLYFYDALAPIVEAESIDLGVAFRGSRYGRGQADEGDYLNCPLDREEYEGLVDALLSAERHTPRGFDAAVHHGVRAGPGTYFEGCLPVEVIAARGRDSLAFGPLRPVGLRDPRTGRRPHAVVQLRQDNAACSLYNLVGFQTTLTADAQQDVFRKIPGLQHATFVRFGQMHRNTFVNAPRVLRPTLQMQRHDQILLAGQITGVEGYLGNVATGLLSGMNASLLAHGRSPIELPPTTVLGALCKYIAHSESTKFQPMKANLGLLEPLPTAVRGKPQRGAAHASRSARALAEALGGIQPLMRIATPQPPQPSNLPSLNRTQATRIGLFVASAFLLLLTGCGAPQTTSVDGARALTLVEQQLAFGPRIPGTEASTQALDWIEELVGRPGLGNQRRGHDVSRGGAEELSGEARIVHCRPHCDRNALRHSALGGS